MTHYDFKNYNFAPGLSRPVLVTGSSGFLGYHLCEALETAGYEVHTLSRKAASSSSAAYAAGRTHLCDLTKPSDEFLPQLLQSRDWYCIIHLAGLIAYTQDDWPAMEAINVEATRVLLSACIEHCPDVKFLFCSSVVAVGANESSSQVPVDEDSVWDSSMQTIGYARTKRAAEDYVRSVGRSGKVATCSLCPSNIFGARDGLKGSRRTQIKAANGYMKLYPRGGMSVVHVKVVVQAFMKALETPVKNSDPGCIWKGTRWLVTGDNVTMKDMLTMYSTESGNAKYAPWVCMPSWVMRLVCWLGQYVGSPSMTMERFLLAKRYNWYDGTRARKRFGLETISARTAIADSVRWMREHGLVKKRLD